MRSRSAQIARHVVQPGEPHPRGVLAGAPARSGPGAAGSLTRGTRCRRSAHGTRAAARRRRRRRPRPRRRAATAAAAPSGRRAATAPTSRSSAGQQRRVRAEAREVLADGELERRPATRARSRTAISTPRRSPPRQNPTTISTSAGRTHSSTSGNGAHGAWRRLVQARARRRGAAARARARAGRAGLGARPRARATAGRSACGCGGPSGRSGCQVANGQPEESLTCHQPISIPMRPSRGRTW